MKITALIAAALLCAAPMAACAPVTAALEGQPPLAGTVRDDQALYAAEAAMFGANTLAEAAVDADLLVPGSPRAVQVADLLQRAKDALGVARTAHRVGNTATAQTAATEALSLIAQVQRILRPQPG